MKEKICKNCKWWMRGYNGIKTGLCDAVDWRRGEDNDTESETQVIIENIDGSRSNLRTREDFGCTLFEPEEN